jgi:hypothetical protein
MVISGYGAFKSMAHRTADDERWTQHYARYEDGSPRCYPEITVAFEHLMLPVMTVESRRHPVAPNCAMT